MLDLIDERVMDMINKQCTARKKGHHCVSRTENYSGNRSEEEICVYCLFLIFPVPNRDSQCMFANKCKIKHITRRLAL